MSATTYVITAMLAIEILIPSKFNAVTVSTCSTQITERRQTGDCTGIAVVVVKIECIAPTPKSSALQ